MPKQAAKKQVVKKAAARRAAAPSSRKTPAKAPKKNNGKAKPAGKSNAAETKNAASAPPPRSGTESRTESGTQRGYRPADPAKFTNNMMKVGRQSQKLIADFLKHQRERAGKAPLDPLNLGGAFLELLKGMATNPQAIVESQVQLWRDYMELWERAARRMMGGKTEPLITPARGDKRFRDADWQNNQIFDFIKQSYLLTANWLEGTAANVEGLDERARRRVAFYAKQFADAISPTNFLITNPEVLRATFETNGENLIKGLQNLVEDIERGEGELAIRQTTDNFHLGENIATTPGKVVFRNELIELIQYEPTTSQVYERPLVIFPPWINKFYILDLKPENSFIRWAVAQGYTVFVTSWVNPDKRLAAKTFEDYMREGIFAAVDAARDATGAKDVNAIGYCIGGTLLSATLAYMAAKKDTRIHAATFFAAQTDFTEAGDLLVFVDDDQLDALAQQMSAAGGILEGRKMATTFNMLRANDLIWSFVINNYMLGKEPVPFDLLYWNSDTTRMPEATHLYYLRRFYRDNAMARGHLKIDGVTLDLGKVTIPVYLQSAKDDHIAPFRSVYKTTKLMKGPIRFIIAGSGHIAGVINPPAANKYQYWTNDKLPGTIEEWQAGAVEHPGSWWPDWDAWLSKKSGGKVKARKPGDGKLKVLGDAPGDYVRVRAK